jgi:hypothetical protein
MNKLERIKKKYPNESFLIAEGFDDAIVGVRFKNKIPRLRYSVEKCLEILMEQNMDYEEAVDYFEYNVRGSNMGEQTPIWCDNKF